MATNLSRKAILEADDLPSRKVAIPQWNGDVYVRTLSGTERDSFEQSCITNRGKDKEMNLENIRARLAVLTVCDEKGERLFQHKDIEALGKKSSKALDLIFDVAQRLNGLGKDDLDDLAGN